MSNSLSAFGAFHTLVSLIAVAAGVTALLAHREITPRTRAGQIYILMTVFTCLTGFFIFHHGGFGKPHALGIVTLLALAMAGVAGYTGIFGRASRYVETVGYSATFFFHMIPGVTETLTRLPLGAPIFSSPEDPGLQKIIGPIFLAFVVGVLLQLRRVYLSRDPWEESRSTPTGMTPRQ